ncbi:MAG: acyl-CoA dehydrogenase family protein, partial [Caldimonas sp.]
MKLSSTPERTAQSLEAIRGLASLVAQHRPAFDRDRRLPNAVFEALAEAGLFRLWLPEALGGPELSPLAFMEVVEAAAELDGSVGWLVGNGAGMSRVGGYLGDSIARDLFSDPTAFVVSATGAVGTAVRVDGGYRISGRWPFGSGAHHATWFMGLCSIKQPDGSDLPPIYCYFPRKNVSIFDTWHVSGLRGTGSCDFAVQDIFVPADHTHASTGLVPPQPGLLYRMPFGSVFPWTVSVVPLGIARGAIMTFAKLASRKTRQGMTALLCDRESVQLCVGRVELLHRSARALLVETMSELMLATDVGGDRLVRARAIFRASCAH